MTSSLKQRLTVLIIVLLLAVALLIPSFFRETLSKNWISKPLALGLDLSGGVHLVYEVVTEEAVKAYMQSTATNIRAALRKEKIAVWTTKAVNLSQDLAVNNNTVNTVEVVVVSDSHTEKAKNYISQNFGVLQFKEQTIEDGKPKLVYTITKEQIEKIKADSIERAVETLRNRVDQFGVAEPLIQKTGDKRVQLQMPGFSDIERVKKVVGSVAKLEFRLVPSGDSTDSITLKNRDGTSIKVENEVLMSGDAVDTATVELATGQVEVTLVLTQDGSRTFKQITTDHVGRELAIILDGVVYSAPRINEPIGGGRASITGAFTIDEADQLSKILRAGALPAPLTVVEERTVGPTLGKDSIKSGVLAILAGFLAIMVFMVFYYKKSGGIAVFCLFLNLVLILAILSFFGATLTLPGLAGLALSIGMAVDSNVIIFERIRDELRLGLSKEASVRSGFDKAYSAIVDTNITVFLSAVILYLLGTGMVKGFAVVLATGIVTTMFSAVFVARIAFDGLSLKGKMNGLSI